MKDRLSRMSEPPSAVGPLWVSALAMVNESGQVLMQQRPAASTHGGLWEFPGGKLEPGEVPEVAIIREIGEELDVIITPDDIRPAGFASDSTGLRAVVILLFVCRSWTGTPQPHAAERLAWYDPGALASLPMPPLDYPLAEALRRLLQNNPH
jgi:8-oxo-dGTP diphosphatase